MPTVYKCPEDVPDLDIAGDLERVLARHERFRPLAGFGLRVDLSLAYNDYGPAITLHGSHPTAKIRVVGPEDRCRGNGDVRVTVDAVRYEELSERQRDAVLAHEMYHVEIQTHPVLRKDDDGKDVVRREADLDPYGRPVVKLLHDDWTITGFAEVASWYGGDSCEVRSYRALGERVASAVSTLPFPEDDPGDAALPGVSSVTLSSGGRAVTLSGPDFEKVGRVGKALRAAAGNRP